METASCPFGSALQAQVGACQQELSQAASAGSWSEQTEHKARLCPQARGKHTRTPSFYSILGYGSYLTSLKKKSMKARFSTHRNTLEARGAPKVPVAVAEGCTWASWVQQDLSLPMVPAHGCFRLHHLRGCRSPQHRLSPPGDKARLSASGEEACSPGNGKLLWEGRWGGVLCLVLFCFG